MIIDRQYPEALQYQPDKRTLDESVQKAKLALLNDIKRSVYIYRVDCGGCNGCEIEIFSTITPVFDAERFGIKNTPSPRHAEVYKHLGDTLNKMTVDADANQALLKQALEKVIVAGGDGKAAAIVSEALIGNGR